jgi:hypothetical protein
MSQSTATPVGSKELLPDKSKPKSGTRALSSSQALVSSNDKGSISISPTTASTKGRQQTKPGEESSVASVTNSEIFRKIAVNNALKEEIATKG